VKIPFIGQTYVSQTPELSTQRSINLMPEAAPPEDSAGAMLVMTPGVAAWTTAGSGAASRGGIKVDGVTYAVYGTSLYKVDSGGTATAIGTILGTERCIFAENKTQLVIVADAHTYYYTVSTSTLAEITHSSFLEASSVVYLDGYFIFAQKGTNQWFISSLVDDTTEEVDLTTFDATERARAFTTSGNIVTVAATHKELWLFKDDNFAEVWQGASNVDFPFSRLGGAYLERGILTKHSVVQTDNTLYWIGNDRTIYRASGYIPQRISHHGIEKQLAEADVVADAFAVAWDERGHKLMGFWFETLGCTHVYDAATGMWHERQSIGYGYWRVNGIIDCYGKKIVLDSLENKLGELDFDTFTEYGNTIQAIRIGQTLSAEGRQFSLDRIEILFQSGVGTESGQGADPDVSLSVSKDFGRNYGTPTRRKLGKIGEYAKRAVWRQRGLYRQATIKILITDPVRRSIVAAYAEITPRMI